MNPERFVLARVLECFEEVDGEHFLLTSHAERVLKGVDIDLMHDAVLEARDRARLADDDIARDRYITAGYCLKRYAEGLPPAEP